MDPAHARHLMVEQQLRRRGVTDERVLAAMEATPRERFVPEDLREFAYEDTPLPIDAGQTISQPYIVALMAAAAEIAPEDRVLEVGAGSGYAAAVLGRLAASVIGIERHQVLADQARRRLQDLGCDNVDILAGDGARGCPRAAPFDAILVAAGGPAVPTALKEQLAPGGRLIMPVGEVGDEQRLTRIRRTEADGFEQEDLGPVMFVPLVTDAPVAAGAIPVLIRQAAEPLPEPDDPAFGAFFDRFAGARVVLLGEASHGTSEFYRARAAITRRLIEAHGFSIVAVEADWPDAASIDRHVRHRPARPDAEPPFRRFPTWMWRNTDVDAFVGWLRGWNDGKDRARQAGFYGLDLYNLAASIAAVLEYLDRVDPGAAKIARERYGCLTPWANEPEAYGRMALSKGYAQCEAAVIRTLGEMLGNRLRYAAEDGESFLDASANARLVKNAEAYYRAMYYGAAESWNLRDSHMFETLCAILDARGPDAKAVVWAHNSHIGDASKTEMGTMREELNVGQLCRERFGAAAALIGFGTHGGTVACADDWDGPMQVKPINPSRPDSYERLAHESGAPRFLLDLREGVHAELRRTLLQPRLERFIGVIYRPQTERWSHYTECSLPGQFDAYVWFDRTAAVTPLPTRQRDGPDDTYPFGL